MRPDDVIDLRKLWSKMDYGHALPQATVLATSDWLAYVSAMAETMPTDDDGTLTYPTEQDALWAWPNGVAIVFDRPLETRHTIISTSVPSQPGTFKRVEPHYETQTVAAIVFAAPRLTTGRTPDGEFIDEVVAFPVLHIGVEPSDVVTGYWLPGSVMEESTAGLISLSTRLVVSIIVALGHRLTRIDEPSRNRAVCKRIGRGLPGGLHVISLSTGASTSERPAGTGSIEWQKHWMVRGHWRLQAHGPNRSLRRPTWIDPYVKGPEDKPLDVRPTIWRTGTE